MLDIPCKHSSLDDSVDIQLHFLFLLNPKLAISGQLKDIQNNPNTSWIPGVTWSYFPEFWELSGEKEDCEKEVASWGKELLGGISPLYILKGWGQAGDSLLASRGQFSSLPSMAV